MEIERRRFLKRLAAELRRALDSHTQAADSEAAFWWLFRLLALRCWHARRLPGFERARALADQLAMQGEDQDQRLPQAALHELLRILKTSADSTGALPAAAVRRQLVSLVWQDVTGLGESRREDPFKDPLALGWLYQHYNDAERRRVFRQARGAKENKIEGLDVVAATQLYTEPYMVKFLVQNSLGAHWLAMHQQEAPESWPFVLRSARWHATRSCSCEAITFLDPACGTGHFLLEAFDLFCDIYRQQYPGLDAADMCRSIMHRNLFGVDIDARAVKLARVSLWLRALELAPKTQIDSWNLHPLPGPDASQVDELGSLVRSRPELQRHYDIVATNPPFMGSRNMGAVLKRHIQRHYPEGKRDLYAAFILRCFELTAPGGRLAFVTQHSWMFLRSFAELRLREVSGNPQPRFGGLLRDATAETLVHLGTSAFNAIDGEVVSVALLTLARHPPQETHHLAAVRLLEQRSATEKQQQLLVEASGNGSCRFTHRVKQHHLALIPSAPIIYWVAPALLALLQRLPTLESLGGVKQGLATGDNQRFVRYSFECPDHQRWRPYAKGGGLRKWHGLETHRVDWQYGGLRLRNLVDAAGRPRSAVRNQITYGQPGVTYTLMARGALGLRLIDGAIYDVASMSIFPSDPTWTRYALMAALNSALYSYLARLITQDIKFNTSYVSRLPLPNAKVAADLHQLGLLAAERKRQLSQWDLLEESFDERLLPAAASLRDYCAAMRESRLNLCAELHTLEGACERLTSRGLGVTADDLEQVYAETGKPAGVLPLLGRQAELPPALQKISSIREYWNKLPRRRMSDEELGQLRVQLHRNYEQQVAAGGIAAVRSSAKSRTRLPAETWLEAASQELQLHPWSVAGLLKENRPAPASPVLDRRCVEDLLTATILRQLGHCWPQDARHESASADGIACLTEVPGHVTLAERVRSELTGRFNMHHPGQLEQDLSVILGISLNDWLGRSFFVHHAAQFKRRPVAWQLQSSRWTLQRIPALACLIGYQRLGSGTIDGIRRRYVAPLRRQLGGKQLEELERFDALLQSVLESGFRCTALDQRVLAEPLDEWCAAQAGGQVPSSFAAMLEQDSYYAPDLNDGVRVNLAPLQRAGLLAAPVLASADVEKAIADRAQWRSDERRWCREGKLARPGWW